MWVLCEKSVEFYKGNLVNMTKNMQKSTYQTKK